MRPPGDAVKNKPQPIALLQFGRTEHRPVRWLEFQLEAVPVFAFSSSLRADQNEDPSGLDSLGEGDHPRDGQAGRSPGPINLVQQGS